mgnify:CR=1 FL=1
MKDDLTHEQQFVLHRLALELKDYSKEELIEALLSCWEARFRQKQIFLASSQEAGFSFNFNDGMAVMPEAAVKEFEQSHGYKPTWEDAEDYMESIAEEACMELDMESIVLEPDE